MIIRTVEELEDFVRRKKIITVPDDQGIVTVFYRGLVRKNGNFYIKDPVHGKIEIFPGMICYLELETVS